MDNGKQNATVKYKGLYHRICLGASIGLLSAFAGLFFSTSKSIPIYQTGSSLGQILFLSHWLIFIVLAATIRRIDRALPIMLAIPGILFVLSASFDDSNRSVLLINCFLVLFGLLFLAAAGLFFQQNKKDRL